MTVCKNLIIPRLLKTYLKVNHKTIAHYWAKERILYFEIVLAISGIFIFIFDSSVNDQ